jgi:hypothetical protein
MMVSFYNVIQEMHSFSERPLKYFYYEPLPKYLDPKTVLIYRPHPVIYAVVFSYVHKIYGAYRWGLVFDDHDDLRYW